MGKHRFKFTALNLADKSAGEILTYLLIAIPFLMVLFYYTGKFIGNHLYLLINK